MRTPELKIDIPLDHPWAQHIIDFSETHWTKPSQRIIECPYGTMTFGGVECMMRLVAIGEIMYERGMAPPRHLKTTWKAYPGNSHVDQIVRILGDASQCTVDPDRAEDIARRAVAEACDNREGK